MQGNSSVGRSQKDQSDVSLAGSLLLSVPDHKSCSLQEATSNTQYEVLLNLLKEAWAAAPAALVRPAPVVWRPHLSSAGCRMLLGRMLDWSCMVLTCMIWTCPILPLYMHLGAGQV